MTFPQSFLPPHPPFEAANRPSWLHDIAPALALMYEATSGPYGSPDPVECWILHWLASHCAGDALEIGSWRGRSACFLAAGLPQPHRLRCVDHFLGDTTGGAEPDFAAMESSLHTFGLRARVDILQADMLTVDLALLGRPALVFYDSDHSTEPTVAALTRIHPILTPGATVIMHDALFASSIEAIAALAPLYHHDGTIPVWHGLGILQRKP